MSHILYTFAIKKLSNKNVKYLSNIYNKFLYALILEKN
jgi:hypothetical protein